jgi:hypothetical protein
MARDPLLDGKMYAGVLVLASARMARRVNASIPDIRIPTRIIDKLESDPEYGLDLALEQIESLRESGLFRRRAPRPGGAASARSRSASGAALRSRRSEYGSSSLAWSRVE